MAHVQDVNQEMVIVEMPISLYNIMSTWDQHVRIVRPALLSPVVAPVVAPSIASASSGRSFLDPSPVDEDEDWENVRCSKCHGPINWDKYYKARAPRRWYCDKCKPSSSAELKSWSE